MEICKILEIYGWFFPLPMTLYYLKVASYIYIFQNISLHTQYFNIDDAKTFVNNNISSDSFSVLHINIPSMQKNFEKFQEFFKTLKFNFSAVCLSETWCDSVDSTKNSSYRFHGYKCFRQTSDGRKGGGLCIFLRNTLTQLNVCLEISTKTSKNLPAIEWWYSTVWETWKAFYRKQRNQKRGDTY